MFVRVVNEIAATESMWSAAFVAALCVASVGAQTPAQRAAALLAKMNIADKIGMVHGTLGPYVVRASVDINLVKVTGSL
jgi:hypothetical protein